MNSELSLRELMEISREDYSRHFRDPDFGASLARVVTERHALGREAKRVVEGSSLVFELGADLFLKLTPPFYKESFRAELAASKLAARRLSVSSPEIVLDGTFESWSYLVSRRVPGLQIKKVFAEFDSKDREQLATDLGSLIKSYREVDCGAFERKYGPWEQYLKERLRHQRELHLAKGNSPEWVEKICAFVDAHADALLALGPPVLVHADLNRDHVMVDRIKGCWRVVGLLDLADSMKAPAEVEYILPFLDFFRGDFRLQGRLLSESGYRRVSDREGFGKVLLALTLQNQFMAFHDWFNRELASGVDSLDALALTVFPGK